MSTFKHGLIAIPLTLAALAVIPAADNGNTPHPGVNPPGMTPHGGTAKADQMRVINTIDPVNGRPVDHSVQTLSVSSTGQMTRQPATAANAGDVVIGFSEKSTCEKVEKAQGKEKDMYIMAARQNRVVKDGRIVDGKMNHDDKTRDNMNRDNMNRDNMDRDNMNRDNMNRDNNKHLDDKTRRDRGMDPAQTTGPNQRGDGLNDAEGANPGVTPRPTDTVPAR